MKLKNLTLILTGSALLAGANSASAQVFTPGDLVVSTVSDQINPGTATNADLDTASSITLLQYGIGSGATSLTAAGSLTLPTTSSGSNSAISGEYGSASEGILEDSTNGAYLTIMGYGVNASTFNSDVSLPTASNPYGTSALGQTTSLTGASSTTVPRVVALIGADGSVDTSTALTGVFNENNPRSVATVDGSSFYVSGQGVTGDGTGGVFYATKGATTATAINSNTTTPTGASSVNPATGTETRTVEIVNTGSGNELMVSRDFKVSGTPNDATDIRSITGPGGALPTTSAGATVTRVLPNTLSSQSNYGSVNLSSSLLLNGVNNSRSGSFVYLSPEDFFLAAPNVMYVADSGQPKNGSANAAGLGEGGLQKWVNSAANGSGTWTLQYDLSAGLNLVNNAMATSTNPTAPGVTGLFGLAGQVEANGTVELFATSYGLNELSGSYLYGITDSLNATAPANGESFTTLETASTGTLIRGVAFAPEAVAAPEPSTTSMLILALLGAAGFAWKRRNSLKA
jgi:hypothetical protein